MLVRGRSRPARPLSEHLTSINRYLSFTNAKTAPQQGPDPDSPGGGRAWRAVTSLVASEMRRADPPGSGQKLRPVTEYADGGGDVSDGQGVTYEAGWLPSRTWPAQRSVKRGGRREPSMTGRRRGRRAVPHPPELFDAVDRLQVG